MSAALAISFEHQAVLAGEVANLVAENAPSLILDGTVGGAGHASAMLEASPNARLIGLDRDPAAIDAAPAGSIGQQPREDLLREALEKAAARGVLVAAAMPLTGT